MKNLLEISLPDGLYYNCSITSDNKYLLSDTNDSSKWKRLRTRLPKGRWSIYSNPIGNNIILINNK